MGSWDGMVGWSYERVVLGEGWGAGMGWWDGVMRELCWGRGGELGW